jgi:hypothetical protein
MVERHVCRGEIILTRHLALISRLAGSGCPTVQAEKLLATFQEIEKEHLAHLARLRRSNAQRTKHLC